MGHKTTCFVKLNEDYLNFKSSLHRKLFKNQFFYDFQFLTEYLSFSGRFASNTAVQDKNMLKSATNEMKKSCVYVYVCKTNKLFLCSFYLLYTFTQKNSHFFHILLLNCVKGFYGNNSYMMKHETTTRECLDVRRKKSG